MSKNTTGKWFLLVIAFIVSCLIWYMVITNDDPRVTISLGNIEVELLNEDQLHEKGLAYYVEQNSSIEVKTNVIQERGWLVKPEDIRLTADLTEASDGKNVIPVTSQVVGNQLIINNNYKLSANTITVRTEKLVEVEIPVSVHTEGDPEDDCSIGTCIPEVDSVGVQVPESLIDYVVSAEATVDTSGRSADYEGEVSLAFYDKDGKAIDCSEKQIFPEKDRISVRIPIGITKNVKIQVPSAAGACSDGYRCTGVEADRKSVTVLGPDKTVKAMEAISIPSGKISLTDRSESFDLTFDLSGFLPEGVVLYDPDDSELKVSVTIEKLETKTLKVSSSDIKIKNSSPSLKKKIVSEQVSVMVQGLAGDLEKVDADQIQLTLDLKGLKAGTYQLKPEYQFEDADGGIEIISLEKATVVITES